MNCIGLFLAVSMHLGLEGDYNQVHPHARCTVENNIAGVFYNSEDKISAYIGKQFKLDEYWNIELGLVTGYQSKDILPMVRYKSGRFFLSPAYEKHNGNKNYGVTVGWEIGK
jgi:hypothetical protein